METNRGGRVVECAKAAERVGRLEQPGKSPLREMEEGQLRQQTVFTPLDMAIEERHCMDRIKFKLLGYLVNFKKNDE